MFTIRKPIYAAICAVMISCLSGCDQIGIFSSQEAGISASGIVEATQVAISSDMSGRVAEVDVAEGDAVERGDSLFRLDNELLFAQRQQAVEALETARVNRDSASDQQETAQAGVDLAESDVVLAQLQYQVALDSARQAVQPARQSIWGQSNPDRIDTPVWFFEQDAQIKAAQSELENASKALDEEKQNLETVERESGSSNLDAALNRLAEAQAAFLVAQDLNDRQLSQDNETRLDTTIQDLYDSASSELESAMEDYQTVLTDEGFDEILEAKSRVAAAEARLQSAQDRLRDLMTGDYSPQVQLAAASLQQAEANASLAQTSLKQARTAVRQADQVIAQAQADLDLINVQIDQLTTRASESGTVTARLIEPGETLQPGSTALMISQLDHPTVTVYIPEDQYGQINLGDHARITSDSFPTDEFDSVVVRIANQAEYTPRNVQTEEDRKTTVFAIDLDVLDPVGRLKPGMPVSVAFQ